MVLPVVGHEFLCPILERRKCIVILAPPFNYCHEPFFTTPLYFMKLCVLANLKSNAKNSLRPPKELFGKNSNIC